MDQLPDVMISVPAEHLNEEVHLMLLRQVIDAQRTNGQLLAKVSDVTNDVDKRLARIESNNLEAKVSETHASMVAMSLRLEKLEDAAIERAGAAKFMNAMKEYLPWVLAFIAAVVLYFEKKPAG